MELDKLVSQFNTIPFLFVGSGISRRYFNLPDWKGLLEYFARKIKDDDFSYSSYENKAAKLDSPEGLLPKVAELIQADYDEKWFNDKSIRTVDKYTMEKIKNGVSPFKAEIAAYIMNKSKLVDVYEEEVQMLSELSVKNISGVITTNYDQFLEQYFVGYKTFVGQKELIFSAIQGVAEIFKIHGSVDEPESIVINEKDYLKFKNENKYLAAKLMTIFMEYPIIFLGYSLSDNNIQNIIESIVECLDEKQLEKLENRFIFVEYQPGKEGVEVTSYAVKINNKQLKMKKITLDDFKILYTALKKKQAKLPVKVFRRFKQELYDFTITSCPTGNLRVAQIEDERLNDEDLVMAIGKYSDFGLKGLHGLESDEWYRNIVLDDIAYSADDLLKYAAPKLYKQNSQKLPLNKILSSSKEHYLDWEKIAYEQSFDTIISNTIKKNRRYLVKYNSVKEIWDNEKSSVEKATNLIAHLTENQIDINELEDVLLELFHNKNVLEESSKGCRTNIRRLIMIYDFLKWGK